MATVMNVTNEAFRMKLEYAAATPERLTYLSAARRDSAAFQVIVNTDSRYSLTKGLHDWYTEKKQFSGKFKRLRLAVEAPFSVSLNPEEFMTDDDLTPKADMLLNQETRESDANVPSVMWVEINVPKDARAGEYPIKVNLYSAEYNSDEVLVASETVLLRVFDYIMPERNKMRFHLDLWQHNSNIARKHDVPLWSDAHFRVIENYVRTLSEISQKSITVIASEIPWCGQSCCDEYKYGGNLYEYSIIGITKELDGSFSYDYSKMQRYIDLCTSYGITGDIEVIGLVNVWIAKDSGVEPMVKDHPEAIRLRYFDKADGCMKYMRHTNDVKDYIKSLEQYFISTHQIDRVRIAADEPKNIEKYRTGLDLIRESAPSFRYKTAINHTEFIEEFGAYIDDFAPYIRCASEEYDRLMEYRRSFDGKRFLWYVCCSGAFPNTFLCSDLTESRQIGIITNAMGFDGFLRWGYTVWPEDPRRDIRYNRFEAGDTCFVYPGYNGDVLLSLRYKNLQRGIGDFELLEAVREKKGDEIAKKLIARVLFVEDFNQYYRIMNEDKTKLFSFDWNRYNDLKAELLSLLEAPSLREVAFSQENDGRSLTTR